MASLLEKWKRILAVSRDPRLAAIDARVAIELVEHLGDGGAYPAQETLSTNVGVSVRTVRESLNRLVSTGHFVRVAHERGGRGHSTVYRLGSGSAHAKGLEGETENTGRGPGEARATAEETRKHTSAFLEGKPEAHSRLCEPETRQSGALKPANWRTKGGSTLPTSPLVRTRLENPITKSSAQLAPTAAREQPSADLPQPLPRSPDEDREFEEKILEIAKLDPARWVGNFGMVHAWRNAGCTDDDILAGISIVASRPGYVPKVNLNYFRGAIEEARDMRRAAEARGEAPPMSPARAADIRADRMAKHAAAYAKAKAEGVKPGDPGFPKADTFGLYLGPNGLEIMPGWRDPKDPRPPANELERRLAAYTAAAAAAREAGHKPEDPEFPQASKFGLSWVDGRSVLLPDWKGPQSSQEASGVKP